MTETSQIRAADSVQRGCYHGRSLAPLISPTVGLDHGSRSSERGGRRLQRAVCQIIAAATLLGSATLVLAQDPVRVRGKIEHATGHIYAVRTRDNTLVQVKITENVSVAASVRSALSDIREGQYIGIAALPQHSGALRAIEVHIFDESMRGTSEGHRAWDLLPQSTMTNAVVADIVTAADGRSVTLTYKDGQQRVLVPPATVVVTYLPGAVSELIPGATVFVPAAILQPDGTVLASRIMVGRNIAPPQ